MALNLPVLPSRYPDQLPTYDLSSLLTNGIVPKQAGSVTASVDTNHVYWDVRVITSGAVDPDYTRFLEGIPVELMPVVHTSRLALHGISATQVQWNASWNFMQIYGARITFGELSFEARTLRRAG